MSPRMRSLAPTLVAGLVVAGSFASLLPLPADVLAQLAGANATRGAALSKCQAVLLKESQKQVAKEAQSLTKCITAVRSDDLSRGLVNVTFRTADLCRKELRKVKDSRSGRKSHAAKAREKMLKACDPSGPTPKPYTEQDVLETMVAGLEGLGGNELKPTCAALTTTVTNATAPVNATVQRVVRVVQPTPIVVNSTASLVDCVVAVNTKTASASAGASSPRAPRSLDRAAAAIRDLPPTPDDPQAESDASGAADAAAGDVDPDGDGAPAPRNSFAAAARIVFVSSTTETGNFSGSINAGEICDGLAAAAGLPGNYLPWVSDASNLAPDELFNRTRKPGVPYVTVTGQLVANQTTDFVNGSLVSPINVDENGALVADAPVWTGTDALGDNAAPNCSNFNSSSGGDSGVIGRTSRSDAGWSNTGTPQTCDQPARIYCIEVDS